MVVFLFNIFRRPTLYNNSSNNNNKKKRVHTVVLNLYGGDKNIIGLSVIIIIIYMVRIKREFVTDRTKKKSFFPESRAHAYGKYYCYDIFFFFLKKYKYINYMTGILQRRGRNSR